MLELEPHIPLPPWSFLLPGPAYQGSVKSYEPSLKSKLRCLELEEPGGTWVALPLLLGDTFVISGLGRLRREDCELGVCLDNIVECVL